MAKIWKTGDKIDITFPMSLRLVATNDNPNMAAVAYGPIVLAGDMGTEGIQAPAPYAKDQLDFRNYAINGRKLNDWLKPVTGKQLTFQTSGVGSQEITLMPYYKIDKQRYVIYWNMK